MLKDHRKFLLFPIVVIACQSSSAFSVVLTKEPMKFQLSAEPTCESLYRVDDLSTLAVEDTCASFDLSGYEASAFQGGIGIGEVGRAGEIRQFWALSELEFNTIQRPLPNPAVSPFIVFRFQKDEVCPSGYTGTILDSSPRNSACLGFSLDGFSGTATRTLNSTKPTDVEVWILDNLKFHDEGR